MLVNGIVFRMTVPIGANVRHRLPYAIYRFAFICCFFFFKSIHDLYTSRFIKSAIKNHRSMP